MYLMKLKQEISKRKDQQGEDTTTGNLLLLKHWKLRIEAGHCCWAKNWMQLFKGL